MTAPLPAAVLLDFDGPVCSLFAGRPPALAARRIADLLRDAGLTPAQERDPHALLAGLPAGRLAAQAHGLLEQEELAAVPSAELTPGVEQAVKEFSSAGVRLAVVSNNASAAVEAFLRGRPVLEEALAGRVFGRDPDPARMKPSPWPLRRALAALGLADRPGDCLFVGDSEADCLSAEAADVPFVGLYGHVPKRRARLLAAGVPETRLLPDWNALNIPVGTRF